jgi:hypothetical protein
VPDAQAAHDRLMPELRHEPDGNRDERPVDWPTSLLYTHVSRIVADQGRRMDDHTLAVERTAAAAVISSERALQAALIASEKAIAKAELATEKRFDAMQNANNTRFEGMNEFRGTLSDQATKFISRSEVEARIDGLTEKINSNQTRVERIEAKGAGLAQGWGWLIGIIGAVLAIYGFISHQATPVPTQAAPVYVAQPPTGAR